MNTIALRIRLQALSDLLRRYRHAWRQAWRARADHRTPPRQGYEVAFMPAALSLQDAPVSPAPRVAMWLLIGFLLLTLLWAVFGRIDVVATAQGKIVPSDRTKTVQSFETASIQAIHVTDGQHVKAGDLLIELDATTAQADTDRLQGERGAAELQVARGQALLAALGTGGREPVMQRPAGVDGARHLEAQRLLSGQYAEFAARLSRIVADTARREAELRSTQEIVRKLEQTVPMAQQRARDYQNLMAQNFVSRHGFMEHEQHRIEQEADLAAQRSRLREIEASLGEVRGQRQALIAETRRGTLDSITEGQQQLDALAQEWKKADVRGRLMRITAPVDGTVQQLAVHTQGGVVTAAQPLMLIVPSDDPLEVEAFFENKDIGFVRAGQRAEVKVETFPFTKYGTIDAAVSTVSHDAINDERRGLIYVSRVRMAKAHLRVEGTDVGLSPGMAVTVEVKTGRRRVIEYFLAPLMQHTSESLRER
ncbi:HlyD family type I secretion periplasmic adaptor subunit [Hydrogenophaga sp. BPS33]|uniref:HlyD family type I secretion periplasmic adaptor subunit n=1 Tax=Hydrogenophaga sp. BPS33 TaxID=2651974 RepID=UPI00132035A9|nr:HlyD family type I secretion periplasmic adaptor subunit [Hydrogenophaga sp. BPS33]QHE88058.1 HlyD family type I secretion periplasmic adaptor subunit [Hydrogenophaga sp. BPS33]